MCRICMPRTKLAARLIKEIVCRYMKRQGRMADQQHQQQRNTVLAIDRHFHHDSAVYSYDRSDQLLVPD